MSGCKSKVVRMREPSHPPGSDYFCPSLCSSVTPVSFPWFPLARWTLESLQAFGQQVFHDPLERKNETTKKSLNTTQVVTSND